MKKLIISSLGFFVAVLFFSTTSCDKIDCTNNGGSSLPVADTVRKILLEDYTGHTCLNCPGAHRKIDDLHKVYGDRMVAIAFHVGFFAKPKAAPFDADYRTSEGSVFEGFFGVSNLPKGVINRKKKNGSYAVGIAGFAESVSLAIDSMPELPDIFIELTPSYKSTDSTISVDAKLTALKDMPAGKYNISIFVIEDDIVSAQIDGANDVFDYHHMHMFRGAINTVWGEEFATSISNGETFTEKHSGYKIGKDWNPDNLKIVAFVYYADGPNEKVVIQAEEVDLK